MHDVLHVSLEGVFNQHNLISYLIDKKIFTYVELNRKLAEYRYSYLDKANKPQELTKINVEKWSLKQTAIAVLPFAYILPHIIGEKIETFLENSPMHDVKDLYLNYLNLVNVVILCTSNYIDHDTPCKCRTVDNTLLMGPLMSYLKDAFHTKMSLFTACT